MQETSTSTPESPASPKWQPLPARQRRVVGVLVEKAKTTPDQYPLSLNALTNGCNQKSNRSPQMNLSSEDVEDALEALRELGAVSEVHGDGRVVRYRHYLKDWLGVDGTELAVMTELLLRGDQTVGELRGRAARMAAGQLPDIGSLRPVLESLIQKGLVVALMPPGRGQSVTHALYSAEELSRIRQKYADGASSAVSQPPATSTPTPDRAPSPAPTSPNPPSPTLQSPASATNANELTALRTELAALTEQVNKLAREIEDIWSNLR